MKTGSLALFVFKNEDYNLPEFNWKKDVILNRMKIRKEEEVMVQMLVIFLVVQVICIFFFTRRYAMSEKVDKGIQFCYWKLSYRRKLIRTIWMIPLNSLVLILFYRTFRSLILTWMFGVWMFLMFAIQLVYNYKKWKKEKNDISESSVDREKGAW